VALGADGAVRLARPAAVDPAGWRALPGVMPCANHDIAAAVVGEHVYVVGGALWWRGFPAREHMFDEVWRMDVRNRERRDAWEVVARLPHKIAFAGLASLGGLLYIFGGCCNRNGVPNERSDESQLWVYDPAAATLTAGPSMRVARQECGGACLGGRVYAFGGAARRERRPDGATMCYRPPGAGSSVPLAAWIHPRDASRWPLRAQIGDYAAAVRLGRSRRRCSVHHPGWDRSCESFGPGESGWRAEAECPIVLGGGDGMAGQFSCTELEGKAYVAGPFGLLSFSPKEGWATLPAPPTAGGCPVVAARQHAQSGLLMAPQRGSPASSDPPVSVLLHALERRSPGRSYRHDRLRCHRRHVTTLELALTQHPGAQGGGVRHERLLLRPCARPDVRAYARRALIRPHHAAVERAAAAAEL
jgi:hypothetical protein